MAVMKPDDSVRQMWPIRTYHVWTMRDLRYGRGDKKVRLHYTYNPPTIKPLISGPAPVVNYNRFQVLAFYVACQSLPCGNHNHCPCLFPKSHAWSQPRSWRIVVVLLHSHWRYSVGQTCSVYTMALLLISLTTKITELGVSEKKRIC